MKLRKNLVLALISCGLSISLSLTHLTVQSITALPGNVLACVPKAVPNAVTEKVKLLARTNYQEKTYYLLEVYATSEPSTWDLIITTDKRNHCEPVFGNPMGDTVSFANFIPVPAARQLELEVLKQAVQKAGGKEKWEAQLLQLAKTEVTYWTDEQIWALKQLGICLPQNIKIISPQSK